MCYGGDWGSESETSVILLVMEGRRRRGFQPDQLASGEQRSQYRNCSSCDQFEGFVMQLEPRPFTQVAVFASGLVVVELSGVAPTPASLLSAARAAFRRSVSAFQRSVAQ